MQLFFFQTISSNLDIKTADSKKMIKTEWNGPFKSEKYGSPQHLILNTAV